MLSRSEILERIYKLAARKVVIFRMLRLRRLEKRLAAFDLS